MKRSLLLPAMLLAAASAAPSQEALYQANRNSREIHEVSLCGEVTNVINLTSNGFDLRRVKQAPDGKLWLINFINPTFTLMNADGSNLQNLVFPLGSPYDVAFDQNGHAWMSGTNGVVEYDANGGQVMTYALPASAPLGITVDADGNKWIAHRIAAPGSVSRIDAMTGAVTNHALPAGSAIQPVSITADFRFGSSSHIWVVGDGGNSLAEFDAAGNALNLYQAGTGNNWTALTTDVNGNLWVGNFSNGTINQINSSGMIVNTFTNAPNVLGLEFDSFGRLWVTTRVSFSGPQPSELRRYDPATGTFEVAATVGLGAGSSASTRYHYALVVHPTFDSDGDGDANIVEVLAGTSPWDPQSSSFTSLLASGVTAVGSIAQLTLQTDPANSTLLGASTARVSPGIPIPGATGLLFLDPLAFLIDPMTSGPLLLTLPGPFSLPVPIPPNGPTGVLHIQGVTLSPGGGGQFTNVTCFKVY